METTVGYVYDPIQLEHDTEDHEENSARLLAVMRELEEVGLLAVLQPLPGRPATLEELTRVHTRAHVAAIERFAARGGGWITPDTVMASGSYRAALHAAGGTIAALEAVVAGEVQSAFALVRPPGHHARPMQAMGFCLFNNVAIAVHQALARHGLERVLIVDFDVHHGNGTQEVFAADPRVLYFSVHEYPFYPGTGSLEETGHGPGRGYTVNVPLPAQCGDQEYQRAFAEVLAPAARRFRPQFVVVSAGYDSHWSDPLALMQVSVPGFAAMIGTLLALAEELCAGKVVLTLEGGYQLPALAAGIRTTFEVLLGRETSRADPLGTPATYRPPEIGPILAAARAIHGL